MDSGPKYGRAEIALHLFPVADLPLIGAEPVPGVAYGRTETPINLLEPIEIDFAVPHLVLTLRLSEEAGAADAEVLALDVLNLVDALSAYEKALGGRGLRLHDKAADAAAITLTLAPVAVDGAADRLNQITGLLASIAGRRETPHAAGVPVLDVMAKLAASPAEQCKVAASRRPWSIEARAAMPA